MNRNMNVQQKPNLAPPIPLPKRLLSIEEAVTYLGLGKSSARKYLESIGAKRKIGRRVLYDKNTIDQHLNHSEGGKIL